MILATIIVCYGVFMAAIGYYMGSTAARREIKQRLWSYTANSSDFTDALIKVTKVDQ